MRLRWPLAYVAGAAIPLVPVLIWLVTAHQTIGTFAYTMFGFRLQLLHTLAGSDIPLHVPVSRTSRSPSGNLDWSSRSW